MKRRIIETGDGSKTIQIEDWGEQYHSKHGAVQEAYHVFIEHGLCLFHKTEVNLLEIGFGTGLNALITLLESEQLELTINYRGVEAFPVSQAEVIALDYGKHFRAKDCETVLKKMHDAPWEESVQLTDTFILQKQKKDFKDVTDKNLFNLIYFDAFGPRVQPELWTEEIFMKMYRSLQKNGTLITYSAKGSVRRALQTVGFLVERLPGPPGKREMLRATKT
ncbi:tRNA (5-methylaminomethyl-2-thiouridine)(34)-methyltransferase MnmD [Muricauda sp. JGD-17]|uniref:tRNA (5-methylaminomethyl-2-thiouridine)(34)-methyltransferase MnmD n=1 Tax=Flagellimonas ochracea TaxID=2696472 RepID=A0A964WVV7_9FLAO|nr:tRNA (5-methylaminomethyl-2-thiouridine)(34)-methyltransferase MnmD [Allomuricauda ochracea]NAY90325.1 tRNA (5-methylaminomethyl-2-thiouridine)(34)-methyltransferase MnmD [Allomuricauda ochracea]